jgi:serine/threonine protein kinase
MGAACSSDAGGRAAVVPVGAEAPSPSPVPLPPPPPFPLTASADELQSAALGAAAASASSSSSLPAAGGNPAGTAPTMESLRGSIQPSSSPARFSLHGSSSPLPSALVERGGMMREATVSVAAGDFAGSSAVGPAGSAEVVGFASAFASLGGVGGDPSPSPTSEVAAAAAARAALAGALPRQALFATIKLTASDADLVLNTNTRTATPLLDGGGAGGSGSGTGTPTREATAAALSALGGRFGAGGGLGPVWLADTRPLGGSGRGIGASAGAGAGPGPGHFGRSASTGSLSPETPLPLTLVRHIEERYVVDPDATALGKGSFGDVVLAYPALPRAAAASSSPSGAGESDDAWRARCRSSGVPVALKRVRPTPDKLSALWQTAATTTTAALKAHSKLKLSLGATRRKLTGGGGGGGGAAGEGAPAPVGPSSPSSPSSPASLPPPPPPQPFPSGAAIIIRDSAAVQAEAAIMKRVRGHEHVVAILDHLFDGETVYIAMEYCGGGDLMKFVQSCRHFSERVAAYLFRQILLGVGHCHARGVVHRDLKPDNLIFASSEGRAHIKIADFGLAAVVRSPDAQMHDAVGSAFFIAPEVFTRTFTMACDAWSLGVNLYLLLSGTVPFGARATRAADVHRAIREQPLAFHGRAWRSISPAARELVTGLLEKNPARRYTVAQALAHPWVAGEAAPDVPLEADVVRSLVSFCRQGRLRKEALRAVSDGLTAADVHKLRAQFHAMDTNVDLTVSAAELADALTRMGRLEAREEEEEGGGGGLGEGQGRGSGGGKGEGPRSARAALASVGGAAAVAAAAAAAAAAARPPARKGGPLDVAETVRELVAGLDLDGDGLINLDEFLAAAAELHLVSHQAHVWRVFQLYDRDGNGKIDAAEARAALRGTEEDEAEILRTIAEYDDDGDGTLRFEEFFRMLVPAAGFTALAFSRDNGTGGDGGEGGEGGEGAL